MNVTTNELTDLGKLYVSLTAHATERPHLAGPDDVISSSGASAAAADAGAAAEGASWSELCAPCIAHLQSGRQLAELAAQDRRYCSESCGFWTEAPGPLSRMRPMEA